MLPESVQLCINNLPSPYLLELTLCSHFLLLLYAFHQQGHVLKLQLLLLLFPYSVLFSLLILLLLFVLLLEQDVPTFMLQLKLLGCVLRLSSLF